MSRAPRRRASTTSATISPRGRRELDRQPEFRGETLSILGLDGFFVTEVRRADSPLFCVSRDERTQQLVCLRSDDNGSTWHDHAVSSGKFRQIYAIGGCREVTPDGWIPARGSRQP